MDNDRNLMTQEDREELLRNDEKFAAMLQKQFDQEIELPDASRQSRCLSPDLVCHPASPIEERLTSFADSPMDPVFEQQLSAQLLKHINSSSAPHSSRQNGLNAMNGINLADQPSTSSTSLSDEMLSEEYARRLQQEYDNESKFMSTNHKTSWDPVSEWRMEDEDEQLKQALRASLFDQPCSSKADSKADQNIETDDLRDQDDEKFPREK